MRESAGPPVYMLILACAGHAPLVAVGGRALPHQKRPGAPGNQEGPGRDAPSPTSPISAMPAELLNSKEQTETAQGSRGRLPSPRSSVIIAVQW